MANEQAYGVLYASNNGQVQTKPVDELLTPSIKFVRVQWVDYTNTVRFRVLSASYFRVLLSNPDSRAGVGLPNPTLGMVGFGLAPGFGAVGEHLYVPDLASWRVCTYAPGHASVMGWFQEKTPSPTHGLTVPHCPRTILERIVREAQDQAGVSFLVGVEHEFILLRETDPEPVYANYAHYSCSAKTRTGSVEAQALEEIATCLIDAGIELQMYHAEEAPGQYEVITGPLPPLAAADAVVFTRETIYNIAHKHGFKATFSPRLHNDSCGSGAHTHISVHGGTLPANEDSDSSRAEAASRAPTLTPTERSFLQGVLTHLPAICALTLPTAASYARVLDGIWSGGTYASWGSYNKEAPIRVCGPTGHHHFELKCVDGTASPYLVLAGLLGAGTRAIVDGAVLTSGDCTKPVVKMSEAERKAVGLENPRRLPGNIVDARKELRSDKVLSGVLGRDFVDKYMDVNELFEMLLAEKDGGVSVKKLIEYL